MSIEKRLTNEELRDNVDRARKLDEMVSGHHVETIIGLHRVAIDFRDKFAVRAYRHEFMLEQWAKKPDDTRQRDILLMYIRDQQRGMLPKLGTEYESWAEEHDAKHEWAEA